MFSSRGKVKGIYDAFLLKTAKEVRSPLGMGKYCAKFIPNFSSIIKTLRDLTKKHSILMGGTTHQSSKPDLPVPSDFIPIAALENNEGIPAHDAVVEQPSIIQLNYPKRHNRRPSSRYAQ